MSLDRLLETLGYHFRDQSLLEAALTHRSLGRNNNERLEFLGDAVLGLCVSELLYRAFPQVEEGDLSRLRASLVNQETLAEIAAEMDLGTYLRLGGGELKSGGFRRASILSDGLEAILGAVYLDGGFSPARDLIRQLYQERVRRLPPPEQLKDPKTRLQECLQGRGLSLPVYAVESISGKEHAQVFEVSCVVPDTNFQSRGRGGSRRKAEQAAAAALLEKVNE